MLGDFYLSDIVEYIMAALDRETAFIFSAVNSTFRKHLPVGKFLAEYNTKFAKFPAFQVHGLPVEYKKINTPCYTYDNRGTLMIPKLKVTIPGVRLWHVLSERVCYTNFAGDMYVYGYENGTNQEMKTLIAGQLNSSHLLLTEAKIMGPVDFIFLHTFLNYFIVNENIYAFGWEADLPAVLFAKNCTMCYSLGEYMVFHISGKNYKMTLAAVNERYIKNLKRGIDRRDVSLSTTNTNTTVESESVD